MNTDYTQQPIRRPYKLYALRAGIAIIAIVAAIFFARFFHMFKSATISVVNFVAPGTPIERELPPTIIPIDKDPEYTLPQKDNSRLDILVLGMRGKDDVANGGLLTDTIMLFTSYPSTGAAALTSIPRDLTIRVTDEQTGKINSVYAHYGISGTKKLFSRILGVSIDNIVVIDFEAFKSVVDTLGGVTITLDQPFTEEEQWGYSFSLPAGANTLNGDQALYYVRSRYGSSDFDRSRRQMQVILGIKNKVADLNLSEDPIQAINLVSAIRKHMETDLNVFDLGNMRDLLLQQDKLSQLKRYHLTTENLLYEAKINGIYELLPLGDTLAHIKDYIASILNTRPRIWTPTPSPTLSNTP